MNKPTHTHLKTTEKAADYTGLSPSFLNKGRISGTRPRFLKLGRRVMYDVRDLDAWLESRSRNSTSEYRGH